MSRDEKSNYYDAGGIETLDIIKAKLTPGQYRGYLLGNAIKYGCRLNFKGCPKRDAEKASNYLRWLKDEFPEGQLTLPAPIAYIYRGEETDDCEYRIPGPQFNNEEEFPACSNPDNPLPHCTGPDCELDRVEEVRIPCAVTGKPCDWHNYDRKTFDSLCMHFKNLNNSCTEELCPIYQTSDEAVQTYTDTMAEADTVENMHTQHAQPDDPTYVEKTPLPCEGEHLDQGICYFYDDEGGFNCEVLKCPLVVCPVTYKECDHYIIDPDGVDGKYCEHPLNTKSKLTSVYCPLCNDPA